MSCMYCHIWGAHVSSVVWSPCCKQPLRPHWLAKVVRPMPLQSAWETSLISSLNRYMQLVLKSRPSRPTIPNAWLQHIRLYPSISVRSDIFNIPRRKVYILAGVTRLWVLSFSDSTMPSMVVILDEGVLWASVSSPSLYIWSTSCRPNIPGHLDLGRLMVLSSIINSIQKTKFSIFSTTRHNWLQPHYPTSQIRCASTQTFSKVRDLCRGISYCAIPVWKVRYYRIHRIETLPRRLRLQEALLETCQRISGSKRVPLWLIRKI